MSLYWSVVANQVWRGNVVQNVLYYETTADLSQAQKQELANGVRAAFANLGGADGFVNDWSLTSVTLTPITFPGWPGELVTFTSGALVGANTNPGIAQQVSLLLSCAAPTPKPRRARTYIGGLAANHITDAGLWDSQMVTNAGIVGAALMAIAMTGDTANRVAVKLASDGSVLDANLLTVVLARGNPAVQRRRRLGTGV